ncbi:NAD(+) synthase [Sanyastnella coralliicola]|uniref:NAD(+) synthase n=1 Tax=Sanyastnella coralliicola TaxID=3069118 RepID=UPI0027BAF801|nr:NAD(+) synthase [Longitalea sp. SCSIO 12813]
MNTSGVVEHIVEWLKEYSLNSKTRGFVVGISGGIDSAVTSALAARTGRPLLCVEMPIHQAPSQVSRGRKHIEMLKAQFDNVSSVEVELTDLYEDFINAVPDTRDKDEAMALVNTRARLRMTTLYYFAGLRQSLVVGTGNKVEDFGVGFFTKYGDGGVDLSPIADLYKSEVYAIAEEMGVISEIMNAAPTDGLWGDDRTDEDQIGASYPELEWAMEFQKNQGDESTLEGRQQEVYAIYTRLHRANQHKMVPIPVCEIPAQLKG